MVESETNLAQPFALHDAPQQVAILGIEQQKTSAARAHQLAADRTVFAAELVPAVYTVVGSAGGASFLVHPVLVHQLAEAPCIALLQSQLDTLAQLLDEMQIIEHGRVASFGADFLIVQNNRSIPRIAG